MGKPTKSLRAHQAFYLATVTVFILFMAPNAVADHKIGTHGYFRIGTGFSGYAQDRACFQAPGADWKYRLGNECDTWVEGGIYDEYRPAGDDGPVIHSEWWLGISIAEGRMRLPRFENTTQLYIQASKLPGWGDAKLWIGRKYYQRHDIHILDFYWSEMLGDGLGVEDIDVTIGKLMYAYTRNSDSVTYENDVDDPDDDIVSEAFQNNHDLRLVNIFDLGLTAQAVVAHSAGNDIIGAPAAVPTMGFAVALWHQDSFDLPADGLSIWNKLSVQYGQGITRNKFRAWNNDIAKTTSADDADDLLATANIIRITEQFLLQAEPVFALFGAFVYQAEDGGEYDNRDLTWYSAGLRPMYFINKNYRVLAEFGFDRTEDKSPQGISGNLAKFTLAGEISTDYGFWNRPVLRAFATWAGWSDSFRGRSGGSGQGDVTDCSTKTLCYNAGVQVEYWW